jgi:hypothetical protein
MLTAIHPITGKEVRILQTDATLTKSSKTLAVCLDPEVRAPCPAWDLLGGPRVLSADYRILLEGPIGSRELQEASSGSRLVFVKKECLVITPDAFRSLGLNNCLMLEELHFLYPQLGGPWDRTPEDAVAMIAGILRMNFVWGLDVSQGRAQALGLRAAASPQRLWWITQYFVPQTAKRRREIDRALEMNSKSSLIDRVILLNERAETLPAASLSSGKVSENVIGHRLTYADVLRFAADAPADVIVAFANADIAIDDASWRSVWSVDLSDKFLALLRYDVPASGDVSQAQIFGPRADSQDCWIVRAADVQARREKLCGAAFEFRFGQMGCDNAIALDMLRAKFVVVNPSQTLRTWHFHASDVRTYSKTDVIDRPVFHYVQPTGIHELEPILVAPPGTTVKPATLLRPVRGPAAARWASLAGSESWKPSSTNPLTPAPETILDLKDCFMTPEGLVYDRKAMYVGPAICAREKWGSAGVSGLLPSVECERVSCVPWPSDFDGSREDYVVRFLSKVLRLGGGGGGDAASPRCSEFYCPESKEILDALQVFKWPGARQPVIKHEQDGQVWCRSARALLVSDNTAPLTEDIDALRGAVVSWLPQAQPQPRIVIVEDETESPLTPKFTVALEEALENRFDVRVVYPGRTSPERMVDMLRGAWGVVVGAGDQKRCGWNWVLPRGARVFEMVGRSAPTFGLELSAAAGLEHRFVDAVVESVLKEVEVELEASTLAADDSDQLPVIWMPRKDLEGYFAHPGDSFREMARLWARAGLVRVREHPTATMVWWGSVGADGVLLYDRPNHDWRMAAPGPEKSWRWALFGNPRPATGKPGSPWFFWPRRPELVEELVAAGAPSRGWVDRPERLVFYGKIENAVQRKRRIGTGQDWSTACSSFWMASGADEPHKFTQRGYLEELAKARFGLCLAGYGLKCHREIECMALGVVPVCAPDVDMDSYAEPLIAGIHYLRVSGPEEARAVTEGFSEAEWTKMSAAAHEWWKRNCSAQGSFALTSKLIADHQ